MNDDLQAYDEIGRRLAESAERQLDRHVRRLLDLPQEEEIIPGWIITHEGTIYFLEASVLRLGRE